MEDTKTELPVGIPCNSRVLEDRFEDMEDASSYDDTGVVDEGLHGWHLENIESLLGVTVGVGVGVAVDVGVVGVCVGVAGGAGVGVGTAMTDAYFL
jgi:hypothetical protein